MISSQLFNVYQKTNDSFHKNPHLVFHVGVEAGFYSEYNNMLLAMIYAYTHQIHFKLYSRFANFGSGEGWEEYFLPFCDSVGGRFHRKHNRRGYTRLNRRRKIKLSIYRFFHSNLLFTQDVWFKFRNQDFAKARYEIPSLGISGDLREACRAFCDLTYRYNEATQREVDALINGLHLPDHFVGMHVRGGDKFLETELLGVNLYIEAAESRIEVSNVFVLTDDYRIVEAMRAVRPQWIIYTLCRPDERGYFHDKVHKDRGQSKREAHIRLFASTDLLLRSELFVGTFSANPGVYVGMRKDPSLCVSVDKFEWFVIK